MNSWSIFKVFFGLGCYSFGGPAAHIGYFRNQFVIQRQWLSEEEFAQLVALSQFLPGPGSSQVGFALGYKQGGLPGAISAFLGFTLPSIFAMMALALVGNQLTEHSAYQGFVHGLKLLAVVVVADATWGMYKNFCQHKVTQLLAGITAVCLLIAPSLWLQLVLILLAGLVGSTWLARSAAPSSSSVFRPNLWPIALFFIVLLSMPWLGEVFSLASLFNDFYQAGTLVFGGGHVVLPLLQTLVGEQLTSDQFLAGYAAAQAVPGPMFTFATFLGYFLYPQPIVGAIVATIAIFAPGFLLLLGVIKHWQVLANQPRIAGALKGVNASVVGLLAAALYQPVMSSAVVNASDMALVVAGFIALKTLKLPIIALIGLFAGLGILVL
ncbi:MULTISPECIES: chromate efflux transporter [unclassified Vibrio]|uniref:Chromate efflux transporter n=1 Tax=Vibrio sp. HB236076 TaxID=3232307 RepID=A0AB39HKV0_9VIBR|nr:chromate efflux transporter [Vibrio sp. HB161653]MDP5253088.1 chromate efflux transporter [Vibrio sp. HB161653]